MSFDNPPFVIDATTVDGEVIRRAIGSLIGSTGGVITGGDLQVTQNGTPNMTVNIGLGQIWVPGSSTSSQGPYYSRNGASISQAINAANATNPRIDTVGVQVQDKAYAGSLTQIAPLYVAGTATSGANLTNLTGKGAVPASSYVLAYVLVPANATSIITADILNVATPVGLGPPPLTPIVASASVTALDGQMIIFGGSPPATVTLPSSPGAGAMVGVTVSASATGASPVTVAAPTGLIFGLAPVAGGVTSIALGANGASVQFLATPAGNWLIISGQQDTGWVAMTAFPSGWTNNGARARLVGNRVFLDGSITNASGSTFVSGAIATMATSMKPTVTQAPITLINNSAAALTITAAGSTISAVGVVNTATVNFYGVSFPID